MKNLKLILFFIITSIGFIITIESFQLYTSNYFDFKYSQIVSYNELFSKEDVSNINLAAKKFNVAPFLYNKTNPALLVARAWFRRPQVERGVRPPSR